MRFVPTSCRIYTTYRGYAAVLLCFAVLVWSTFALVAPGAVAQPVDGGSDPELPPVLEYGSEPVQLGPQTWAVSGELLGYGPVLSASGGFGDFDLYGARGALIEGLAAHYETTTPGGERVVLSSGTSTTERPVLAGDQVALTLETTGVSAAYVTLQGTDLQDSTRADCVPPTTTRSGSMTDLTVVYNTSNQGLETIDDFLSGPVSGVYVIADLDNDSARELVLASSTAMPLNFGGTQRVVVLDKGDDIPELTPFERLVEVTAGSANTVSVTAGGALLEADSADAVVALLRPSVPVPSATATVNSVADYAWQQPDRVSLGDVMRTTAVRSDAAEIAIGFGIGASSFGRVVSGLRTRVGGNVLPVPDPDSGTTLTLWANESLVGATTISPDTGRFDFDLAIPQELTERDMAFTVRLTSGNEGCGSEVLRTLSLDPSSWVSAESFGGLTGLSRWPQVTQGKLAVLDPGRAGLEAAVALVSSITEYAGTPLSVAMVPGLDNGDQAILVVAGNTSVDLPLLIDTVSGELLGTNATYTGIDTAGDVNVLQTVRMSTGRDVLYFSGEVDQAVTDTLTQWPLLTGDAALWRTGSAVQFIDTHSGATSPKPAQEPLDELVEEPPGIGSLIVGGFAVGLIILMTLFIVKQAYARFVRR